RFLWRPALSALSGLPGLGQDRAGTRRAETVGRDEEELLGPRPRQAGEVDEELVAPPLAGRMPGIMNLPCEGGPTTSWYACAPLQRQRWRSRALFCGRAASCSSSPQAPQRLAAGVSLAPTPAAANLARERSSRR